MMHKTRGRFLSGAAVLALTTGPSGIAKADPPASLPLLPSVARIRVEVSRKGALVIHDVNLARGSFAGEDIESFVAFGAPGAPRAFEASLLPVAPGALETPDGEQGLSLEWGYARKRPSSAIPLLGRANMAGVDITLPGSAMVRALASSGMATLRLRTLLALPAADADGSRELVIRLGDADSTPLVLGRIEVVTPEAKWLDGVEARLCRPSAFGDALMVRTVTPEGIAHLAPPNAAPTVLSTRKSGEDLCLRVRTRK